MVDKWIQWYLTNPQFKPEHIELKVWSEQYQYQGTLDCVAKIGKKLVVVDWKTSKSIYPDMGLQLAAYAKAYEERYGKKINTGLIVLVTKERPHRLITKEFKLGKRLFNKFLKLRLAMPERVCTEHDYIDLP